MSFEADLVTSGESTDPAVRKKDKVRSAWIAFTSRILAQLVGAGVSIVLGLMIVDRRMPAARHDAVPAASQAPAVARIANSTTDARPSIAVLPLADHSPGGSNGFAEALTDALTAALAQRPGLRVISRTSAAGLRADGRTLPEIARALQVDAVIEGSVLRSGERLRVTANLVDGRTDEHLWAGVLERDGSDVIALQADVVDAIADGAQSILGTPGAPQAPRPPRAAPASVTAVPATADPATVFP